jgi:hypothetical protein
LSGRKVIKNNHYFSLARASLLQVDALSGSENDPLVEIVENETTMSKSQMTSSSAKIDLV